MIMRRRINLLSLLMAMALVLGISPVTWAESIPALPAQAVIDSPILGAANLCNNPDDYFTPQALYFNGTPLTVVEISPTHGDYPPEMLENGDDRWAKVIIGKTDAYAGIEGYIPLAAISFDTPGAHALPKARLEGSETIDLYQDNGLTDKIVGSYPKDTQVQIMGWLLDWAQVETGDKTGFVPQDALALDDDAMEMLFAALPPSFDDIQPGHQALYAAYTDELMKLYAQHGDSNEWPLQVKAQASELAAQYGYRYTPDINVMPEADDLSEEAVLAAAKEAAKKLFNLPEDNWSRHALTFSHPEGEPEAAGWKVNLWSTPGSQDAVIWLDRKGEVTGSLLGEPSYAEDMYPDPEALETITSQVDYYLYGKDAVPGEGELTKQQSEDMAWKMFQKAYHQAGAPDEYTFESRFMQNDEGNLKWWLVSVVPPFPQEWMVRFDVALTAPAGEPAYTTDVGVFEDTMLWAKRQMSFDAMEKERGPYSSWTLEQKAEWDPGFYGLPETDEIPLEQAIALARTSIMEAFSLTEAQLDALEESVLFDIVDGRSWRIAYMTGGEVTEGEPWEYYGVVLDAKTGGIIEVTGPVPIE